MRRFMSHCLNVSNDVLRRHMKLENVSFETIYVLGVDFKLAYNTNLSSSDGLVFVISIIKNKITTNLFKYLSIIKLITYSDSV